MIKLAGKLPNKITVACSGGVDSMCLLDFLRRGRKNINVAFFHHGTPYCDPANSLVERYCAEHGLELLQSSPSRERQPKESLEEYWRNMRYEFLHSIDNPVATAHTLNDSVETYVFSSLHGTAKVIPYNRENVFRPFILTTKEKVLQWCSNRNVDWFEDPSNESLSHMRNYVRHVLLPGAYHVNPGLNKVVEKIVRKRVDIEANLFYNSYMAN